MTTFAGVSKETAGKNPRMNISICEKQEREAGYGNRETGNGTVCAFHQ